jgi:hypothetical protein
MPPAVPAPTYPRVRLGRDARLELRGLRRHAGTLAVKGDDDADELLDTDPLALLLGMLLDQQVR